MAWSYAAPQSGDKDKVRYLVQDTDTNDQLVTDEEILWELSRHSSFTTAAASVSEAIARKFARQATISDAGFKVHLNERAQFYWTLARDLRTRGQAVSPFAGGISVANKQLHEDDSDRVQPIFTREQFNLPGSDHTSTGLDATE